MTDFPLLQIHRLRISFAWYDLWIGLFVDQSHHRLYFCPLPCLLFTFQL